VRLTRADADQRERGAGRKGGEILPELRQDAVVTAPQKRRGQLVGPATDEIRAFDLRAIGAQSSGSAARRLNHQSFGSPCMLAPSTNRARVAGGVARLMDQQNRR
jgi:hypothetical protein